MKTFDHSATSPHALSEQDALRDAKFASQGVRVRCVRTRLRFASTRPLGHVSAPISVLSLRYLRTVSVRLVAALGLLERRALACRPLQCKTRNGTLAIMRKITHTIVLGSLAALAFSLPVSAAQEEPAAAPSPNEIVEAAPGVDWVAIAPEDMLVMTLAPDWEGKSRQVVIQLMPAPFSQGWVENIRTLARAKWYDGISVNRVQDNYVVQWGDPGHDNPEGQGLETKPLPEGLNVMGEEDYEADNIISIPDPRGRPRLNYALGAMIVRNAIIAAQGGVKVPKELADALKSESGAPSPNMIGTNKQGDTYAPLSSVAMGWPIAADLTANGQGSGKFWPVHCYGMVGVGRDYAPDTGSGAELYTVIGHAPRHLDRNIALVGRVIEGIEHLSSLPRGSGALGFYTEDEADKRTPILSIRVVSDLPEAERPAYEFLNTESQTFARYANARANRRDPWFIRPAGGADICNIPVPVRRTPKG